MHPTTDSIQCAGLPGLLKIQHCYFIPNDCLNPPLAPHPLAPPTLTRLSSMGAIRNITGIKNYL